MRKITKFIASFLTIGITAIINCNHSIAKDSTDYQVTKDPVKEEKWYIPSSNISNITVKTNNETIIVLQQSYRQEDKLTIIPPHSERHYQFMEFSNCFRFIDSHQKVDKKCFNVK